MNVNLNIYTAAGVIPVRCNMQLSCVCEAHSTGGQQLVECTCTCSLCCFVVHVLMCLGSWCSGTHIHIKYNECCAIVYAHSTHVHVKSCNRAVGEIEGVVMGTNGSGH